MAIISALLILFLVAAPTVSFAADDEGDAHSETTDEQAAEVSVSAEYGWISRKRRYHAKLDCVGVLCCSGWRSWLGCYWCWLLAADG